MFMLHHYPESPYAEKIRAMLGYTGLGWGSVDVPPQPPRPSLDPLLGGYRRIPVAQEGADLFCDTKTIASEIAARTGRAELAHENASAEATAFIDYAEGDIFAAAIFSSPMLPMLFKMLLKRGIGLFKFMADRAGAAKDGGIGNVTREEAPAIWAKHLDDVAERLAGRAFLGGDTPDIQDFAAFHTVWIYSLQAGGKIGPADVTAWRDRVAAFGHGTPQKISVKQALEMAASSEPAPVPDSMAVPPRAVAIAPDDYMTNPTTGTLVGESDLKWIIARQTPAHGLVHVHFPKAGYVLNEE